MLYLDRVAGLWRGSLHGEHNLKLLVGNVAGGHRPQRGVAVNLKRSHENILHSGLYLASLSYCCPQ